MQESSKDRGTVAEGLSHEYHITRLERAKLALTIKATTSKNGLSQRRGIRKIETRRCGVKIDA